MKNVSLMLAISQAVSDVAYADPQIVVIVNPAAEKLTKDQVSDLFLGKIKIYEPLDLPNSAPAKAEFYQKVSGRDSSVGAGPACHKRHAACQFRAGYDDKARWMAEELALLERCERQSLSDRLRVGQLSALGDVPVREPDQTLLLA